ncbi:hypothetical protein BJX70DRAFT_66304 [Aspergillus crustosus]
MRLPLAILLVAASTLWGHWAAVAESVNVVEIDLVYPRNESYPPTEAFPVVFAVKNTQHAELLNPRITYTIFNADDNNTPASWPSSTPPFELYRSNWTNVTDPHFVPQRHNGTKPGHWQLTWQLTWESCDVVALNDDESDGGIITHKYTTTRMFTIHNSTAAPQKEVDLAAATVDGKCNDNGGRNAVGINVTDTTMKAPADLNRAHRDTCVLTTNTTSAASASSPDPCSVSIPPEVAASISARWFAVRCNSFDPPGDCRQDDKNAAQPLIFLGVTGLLVGAGALGLVRSML